MHGTVLLGALSVVLGFIAYGVYVVQMTVRSIVPHPFSWLLWGMVTLVAFLVQHGEGVRAGSWVTGCAAAVCLPIGVVTLLRGRCQYRSSDWMALGAGLLVFAFYLTTRAPLASAVLATATDVIGYAPTLRKGWSEPASDSLTTFAFNSAKYFVALPALGVYTVATWIYPAVIGSMNAGVVVVLAARRARLRPGRKARAQKPVAT